MNEMEYRILSVIATNPGVPRDLLTLFNANGYCERTIRSAFENGYIREHVLGKKKKQYKKPYKPERAEGKKKTKKPKIQVRHCLYLKPEGLRHLASDFKSEGWPGYVDMATTKKCSVFGSETMNASLENAMCRVSEANVFFSLCGAEVLLLPHTNQVQGKMSLKKPDREPAPNSQVQIIRNAAKQCDESILNERIISWKCKGAAKPEIPEGTIRFLPKLVIKCELGYVDKDRNQCKFIGIADTVKKCCLVYCGEGNVFSLLYEPGDKDCKVLDTWKSQRTICEARCPASAIVLIRNARQFGSIIRDMAKQRIINSKIASNTYYRFEKTYIGPEKREGAAHLRWLMSCDDAEVEKEITQNMILQRRAKQIPDGNLFPMEADGRKCAVVCMLEAGKIINAMDELKDQGAALVCFEWQRQYLEAVFDSPVFIEAERYLVKNRCETNLPNLDASSRRD